MLGKRYRAVLDILEPPPAVCDATEASVLEQFGVSAQRVDYYQGNVQPLHDYLTDVCQIIRTQLLQDDSEPAPLILRLSLRYKCKREGFDPTVDFAKVNDFMRSYITRHWGHTDVDTCMFTEEVGAPLCFRLRTQSPRHVCCKWRSCDIPGVGTYGHKLANDLSYLHVSDEDIDAAVGGDDGYSPLRDYLQESVVEQCDATMMFFHPALGQRDVRPCPGPMGATMQFSVLLLPDRDGSSFVYMLPLQMEAFRSRASLMFGGTHSQKITYCWSIWDQLPPLRLLPDLLSNSRGQSIVVPMFDGKSSSSQSGSAYFSIINVAADSCVIAAFETCPLRQFHTMTVHPLQHPTLLVVDADQPAGELVASTPHHLLSVLRSAAAARGGRLLDFRVSVIRQSVEQTVEGVFDLFRQSLNPIDDHRCRIDPLAICMEDSLWVDEAPGSPADPAYMKSLPAVPLRCPLLIQCEERESYPVFCDSVLLTFHVGECD